MKKILCLTLIVLSFAGSAFATSAASTKGGQTIKGGADATAAAAAPTPLIRFSTGVFGLVNYTALNNTSLGYLVATRHATGSKNFATANDITNIYWKQVTVDKTKGTDALLATDVTSSDVSSTVFANTWTSY